MLTQPTVQLAVGRLFGHRGCKPAELFTSIERHPTVVVAERAAPYPDHSAGGAQLVQQPRLVATYPLAERVAFVDRPGQEGALELCHDVERPVEATLLGANTLPERQEACECDGWDGFDLPPQAGERSAPQRA